MPAPTANLPIVGNIVTAEGRNAVLNDALRQLWQALLANATEEQIAEVLAAAASATASAASATASAASALSAYQGRQYSTRAGFVAATAYVNGADAPADGTVATAGGLQYVRSAGATALPDLPGWLPFVDVYADHWAENVTPGTTNMLAAIHAGLSYASTRGQVLHLFGKTYYHSATIEFPFVRGLRLLGDQASRISADVFATRLVSDATTGPQILRTNSTQDIVGVTVRAIGARAALPYSVDTPGILTEFGTDNSGLGCEGNLLRDVLVTNQPGDGFQWSGYAFMNINEGIAARDNKGRPFHVDDGLLTGRTNRARPGGFKFISSRTFGNAGPPKFGNRGTFGVYRLLIDDADWQPGVQDAALNPDNVAFDYHGESGRFNSLAIEGRIGGTPVLNGGLVSGRDNKFTTPRFVGVAGLLRAVADTAIGCDDLIINTPFITNDCTVNPAIEISGAVGNIVVLAPIQGGAGQASVTNWFTPGYVKGVTLSDTSLNLFSKNFSANVVNANGPSNSAVTISRNSAEAGMSITRTGTGAGTYRASVAGGIAQQELNGNVVGGTQITIADDAVATITPPRTGGIAMIMQNGNSAFPSAVHSQMIFYDCGSSLQIQAIASGLGSSVSLVTTDVTGTTGTDGNTTIAALAGVLKIENRSNSSATYQVTFL